MALTKDEEFDLREAYNKVKIIPLAHRTQEDRKIAYDFLTKIQFKMIVQDYSIPINFFSSYKRAHFFNNFIEYVNHENGKYMTKEECKILYLGLTDRKDISDTWLREFLRHFIKADLIIRIRNPKDKRIYVYCLSNDLKGEDNFRFQRCKEIIAERLDKYNEEHKGENNDIN
jgi:hypothetical protein